MRYLFLILNSILIFPCYSQIAERSIVSKIGFITVQYSGCDNKNCFADYEGILISLFNFSNEDYYIENGFDIGSELSFYQNDIYKKLTFLDDDKDSVDYTLAPNDFEVIMKNGNGFNNQFSKPDDLLNYTDNLIANQLKNTVGIGRSYSLLRSMSVIYIKAHSNHTFFFSLTGSDLKGKYKVSLKHQTLNKESRLGYPKYTLPDKIKEYKKYTGDITSNVLEIFISPNRPRKL